MRKLQCIVMLVLLFLVVQPTYAGQITLRVSTWLSSQEEGDMYQRWADKYSESHPNIKVVFEAATVDKLLTEAIAGSAPDIMRVERNRFVSMADQNLIKPIPTEWLSEINVNDLFPASKAQGTYKGRLYGWDPHVGVLALHYNKTAFDNAGVRYPDSTLTWDMVPLIAKKLTMRNSDGTASQWGFHVNYIRPSEQWLLNTWTQGADILSPDLKPIFPNAATAKSLNYMLGLVLESRVSPPTNIDVNKAFVAGQAAMMIQGTWQNAAFEASDKIVHGTTVIPHDTQRATMATLHLWAMSSATKYPRETWELFKYWVGVQNSLEFTDYGGAKAQGLPVWRSGLQSPQWHMSAPLKPALEMMEYTRPLPFTPGMGPWWSKVSATIKNVLFNNKPVTEALEEMAKQVTIEFETAGAYK